MENKGQIFITGATGFVGSRLLPQLQDRRCLILEHRTKFQYQNGCTVCKLEELDRLRGVSQVMHLGAKIRGNRNEIYQANLDLTNVN